MASPPPEYSSQEQQHRFMAAKLLMSTFVAPTTRAYGSTCLSDAATAATRPLPPPPRPKAVPNSLNPFDCGGRMDAQLNRKRSRSRKTERSESRATQQHEKGRPVTRKTAHQLKKEERNELLEQARLLETQLQQLRLRAGLPTTADRYAVSEASEQNTALDEGIHANRQHAVQLLSMVTQHQQLPPVNTLSTFIHLPREQERRRAILEGMKNVKLRRAASDGIARFRDLEANLSYLREERFTTDDGTYHCNRFEIVAFPQFKSARQMYDALLFWIYNMEISVTEMVNQVAVREDSDVIGPTIWNHRIVTTTEDIGVTEELNNVGFAQFYDHYDLMDGGPLGVMAGESVDVDDLFPYKPLERTRKSVAAYHLFSEYVDPQTQKMTVLMKTVVLNAQHAPLFPVEPHVIEKLHAYMSRWSELMNQFLSTYVVPP